MNILTWLFSLPLAALFAHVLWKNSFRKKWELRGGYVVDAEKSPYLFGFIQLFALLLVVMFLWYFWSERYSAFAQISEFLNGF